MQHHSQRYPPRNRFGAHRRPGVFIVGGTKGVVTVDGHEATLIANRRDFHRLVPAIGSVLSGKPGLTLRTQEVELVLSEDELARLLLGTLQPDEVLRLLREFGAFYEISNRFYDEDSGVAIHRRPLYAELHELNTGFGDTGPAALQAVPPFRLRSDSDGLALER